MKQENLEKLNQKIKEIAKSYTKEWKLSYEQPDAGAVLAKIFSGMMYETGEKFSKIMDSHKNMFLQVLNVRDQSAVGATAVVVFESNRGKKETVLVPAGTKLIAKNEKGENIYFETAASLYAGGGEVTAVFSVQEALDKIYIFYQKDRRGELSNLPILWIPLKLNDNGHIMYLEQSVLFQQSGKNSIYIKFDILGDTKDAKAAEELFSAAVWQYYRKKEGFVNFSKKRIKENIIELSLLEGEEIELLDEESEDSLQTGYYVRAVFNSEAGKFYPKLTAGSITLRAQAKPIEPSVLYADDVQIMNGLFAPFGELFHLYSEFFIGSDIIFKKRAAKITIRFVLSFRTFVQKVEMPELEIEWKAIMKKPREIKQVEKDVYIEEVVWEYFNGKGYARLNSEMNYEDLFDARGYKEDKTAITLEFVCPSDWESVMVKAHSGFFLRARVLRAQNIYHMPATFYSPVIDEMRLSYEYPDFFKTPSAIVCKHNLDTMFFSGESRKISVYEPLSGSYHYQYFVLDYIGEHSVSLYFKIENKKKEYGRICWEYSTETGFSQVEVSDETAQFNHSGLIIFPKMEGIKRKRLYGIEGYFLRCYRAGKEGECVAEKFPSVILKEIYKNAVAVLQQESMPDEYFFVEEVRPFFQIVLSKTGCLSVSVYVNEIQGLSEREVLEMYMGEIETIAEKDSSGNIKSLFVKWEETEDFESADALARVYALDKKKGVITFGDGNKGRLPPVSKTEVILVRYKTGRGSEGNVDAGTICTSASSLKGIRRLFNPERAAGGCSYRSTEEEREMSVHYLNHLNRLVTWEDMERLAREAVRGIAGVKAGSYFNERGERVPGKILLTVLHQDYNKGREVFLAQKEKICNHLHKLCDGCMEKEQIVIEEPQFFQYNIRLWLKSLTEENKSDLELEIRNSLSTFFDPVTGGFLGKGWEIGTYPERQQILNYLRFQRFPVSIIDIYISITRVTFAEDTQEEGQEANGDKNKSEYEYESLKLWKNQVLVGLNGIHKLVWV